MIGDLGREAAAIAAILAARSDQLARGHTLEADLAKSAADLARIGRRLLLEAIDVLEPGDHQNIAVGIKRLARAGAMMLAAIARAAEEETPSPPTLIATGEN